jgi:hypothetical protein
MAYPHEDEPAWTIKDGKKAFRNRGGTTAGADATTHTTAADQPN